MAADSALDVLEFVAQAEGAPAWIDLAARRRSSAEERTLAALLRLADEKIPLLEGEIRVLRAMQRWSHARRALEQHRSQR